MSDESTTGKNGRKIIPLSRVKRHLDSSANSESNRAPAFNQSATSDSPAASPSSQQMFRPSTFTPTQSTFSFGAPPETTSSPTPSLSSFNFSFSSPMKSTAHDTSKTGDQFSSSSAADTTQKSGNSAPVFSFSIPGHEKKNLGGGSASLSEPKSTTLGEQEKAKVVSEQPKPSFSFGKEPQPGTPFEPSTESTLSTSTSSHDEQQNRKRKNNDNEEQRSKNVRLLGSVHAHQPHESSPLSTSFRATSPNTPDSGDSPNKPEATKFDLSRLGKQQEAAKDDYTPTDTTPAPKPFSFKLSTVMKNAADKEAKGKERAQTTETREKETKPISLSRTFNTREDAKPLDVEDVPRPEEKSTSKSSDIFGPIQNSKAAQTKIDVNITSPDKIEVHTRYLHLPVDARAELVDLEAFLQAQKNACSTISTRMDTYGDKGLSEVGETISELGKSATAMSYTCERYRTAVERLQDETDYNLRAARVSEDVLKDGSNSRVTGAMVQKQFYADLLAKCTADLHEYKKRVDEMEEEIKSIRDRGAQPPQHLMETIRTQHAVFISMAGKVSDLHDTVEKMKNLPSQRRH